MKKISNSELQEIFDVARDLYVLSSQGDLNHQQFVAQCYLHACAKTLCLADLSFEEKVPYSPADE